MTDKPAAIEAEFCTFKHVPTRKVFQLILELPEEGMAAAFDALGHPNGKQIRVAVARMADNATSTDNDPVPMAMKAIHEKRRFDSLPLPQQAGILSHDELFLKFADKKGYDVEIDEHVENWLREKCGVTSRADILPGTEAAEKFFAIRDQFHLWKRGYE